MSAEKLKRLDLWLSEECAAGRISDKESRLVYAAARLEEEEKAARVARAERARRTPEQRAAARERRRGRKAQRRQQRAAELAALSPGERTNRAKQAAEKAAARARRHQQENEMEAQFVGPWDSKEDRIWAQTVLAAKAARERGIEA